MKGNIFTRWYWRGHYARKAKEMAEIEEALSCLGDSRHGGRAPDDMKAACLQNMLADFVAHHQMRLIIVFWAGVIAAFPIAWTIQ